MKNFEFNLVDAAKSFNQIVDEKQESINKTIFFFFNAISGFPGKEDTFRLKRNPRDHNSLITLSSNLVLLE